MNFVVVEESGEWIVRHLEIEVARFSRQAAALEEVARRMGAAGEGGAASLALKFQPKLVGAARPF